MHLIILGAVASTGCKDALSPSTVQGTYPLASVDGQPLPGTHLVQGGCPAKFTGGSLVLTAQGGASLRFDYTITCPSTTAAVGTYFATGGTFALSGSGISITGVFSQLPYSFTGAVQGNMVHLHFGDTASVVAWADPDLGFGPRQ